MGKSNRFDSDDFEFSFESRNRDRKRAQARKHKEIEKSSFFSSDKDEKTLDFHGTARNRDWRYRI